MVIEKDRVVTIDYKLRDAAGRGPGLFRRLGSPRSTSTATITSSPASRSISSASRPGTRSPAWCPAEGRLRGAGRGPRIQGSKSDFGEGAPIEMGMQFEAHGEEGAQIVTVMGIEGDEVTIDANHPLAGEELHFTVKVVDVREATAEELEHGHVHGGCDCDGECGDGETGGCGDGGCGCSD